MYSLLKISLCMAMLLSVVAAGGQDHTKQSPPDTSKRVSILFPFDSAVIDSSFMNNARALRLLHWIMTDKKTTSRLDSIVITGAASPDGAPVHNRRLALRRANSIKEYIMNIYPGIPRSIVRARADRRYWEGLIEAVERDPDVPGRSELLTTLRDPGLSNDTKNRRMNSMEGGKTFAYLRDNLILRRLRTGSTIVEFNPPLQAADPLPEPQSTPGSKHSAQPAPGSAIPDKSEHQTEPGPMVDIIVVEPELIITQPMALRTNLLLDLVGGPNLGIEIPLGRHFSVAGDFAYAYTRIKNTYALQTLRGTVEASYWFNPRRNKLTGWHLGVYGTYNSRFDVQWGRGFQGDGYWSAGLSGGYSVALSDNFNLGFSVMGGYFHSPEIREYTRPRDGHLMWKETRYDVGRIALTQVRVNLVWLINKKTWK